MSQQFNNQFGPGGFQQQQQFQNPQQGFQNAPQQQFQTFGSMPQQMQHQPQQQMAPQPQGVPELYLPDDATLAAAEAKALAEAERIAKARAGAFGGNGMRFFKPLGPSGEKDWRKSSVPIGYAAKYAIWLLPSPDPQRRDPGVEEVTLFWKSDRKPQGDSIGESPIIKAARDILFKSGDDKAVEWARSHGKPRKQFIYQFILLHDFQGHYQNALTSHADDTGKLTPWVMRLSSEPNKDLVELLRQRTATRVMHPQHGRPLQLTKKKTGAGDMDVETKIIDLDPQPLHEAFWPVLHNLWDLTKLVSQPTAEEVHRALTEMRLPITQDIQNMLMQQHAQEQSAKARQVQLSTSMMGQQFQNAPTQQQPYQVQGQQQPVSFQNAPNPPTTNPFQNQGQQQLQHAQFGAQPSTAYQPQPSQNGGYVVPQGFQQPPQQQQVQPQQQLVKGQIAIALPDGRERCFGNFNPTWQLCQLCPDWIKQQCMPQSPQQTQQQNPQLVQLHNQMRS